MFFNSTQCEQFERDGYIVERNFADRLTCELMLSAIDRALAPALAPAEFESDVQYPGAPKDRQAVGGNTPRRLLSAYSRDRIFQQWSTSEEVTNRIKQLLHCDRIMLSQNHHNCIMTKHPGFSSATLWHQDIRYWLFDRPELVSVWLALGDEYAENGGMQMIAGTHRQHFERGRYDKAFFLRTDLKKNQALIDSAEYVNLRQGDVLFFHSGVFHAAGRNATDDIKKSVVFTYRDETNKPIAGTRSAYYEDVLCDLREFV